MLYLYLYKRSLVRSFARSLAYPQSTCPNTYEAEAQLHLFFPRIIIYITEMCRKRARSSRIHVVAVASETMVFCVCVCTVYARRLKSVAAGKLRFVSLHTTAFGVLY